MVLILFVTVMARVFLKERITVVKTASIILSIFAVVLVIQPEFLFGAGSATTDEYSAVLRQNCQISGNGSYDLENTLQNLTIAPTEGAETYVSTGGAVLGYVFITLCGLSGAMNSVIQKMRLSTGSVLAIMFWTAIVSIIVPLILSLITEHNDLAFPTDAGNVLLVLCHSFATAGSLIISLQGLFMTTAIWLSMAISMQIFFLMIAQYTVLSGIEPGKNNWIEVLGAVLVLISAVIPPVWEIIKQKLILKVKYQKLPN